MREPLRRWQLVVLFAVLTAVAACGSGEESQSDQAGNSGRPVEFLALGDSYTFGESVPRSDRWPAQLVFDLRANGVEVSEPEIIAVTGWATDQLIAAIAEAPVPDNAYNLVSLQIGVNNQFRNYPIAQYETEFAELLQTAVDFAGGDAERVIVLSIPDYAVTPIGQGLNPQKISTEIDNYNSIAKRQTEEAGATFFDITGISRGADEDRSLLAPDLLHPSGFQYRLWVDLVRAHVEELLK